MYAHITMSALTEPTAALTEPTAALTEPTVALTEPTVALTGPTVVDTDEANSFNSSNLLSYQLDSMLIVSTYVSLYFLFVCCK